MALAINLVLFVVGVVVGLLANSLALLSDAAHLLFGIEHTTLQVDHAPKAGPIEIDLGEGGAG